MQVLIERHAPKPCSVRFRQRAQMRYHGLGMRTAAREIVVPVVTQEFRMHRNSLARFSVMADETGRIACQQPARYRESDLRQYPDEEPSRVDTLLC